jgi:hypothetical protein
MQRVSVLIKAQVRAIHAVSVLARMKSEKNEVIF